MERWARSEWLSDLNPDVDLEPVFLLTIIQYFSLWEPGPGLISSVPIIVLWRLVLSLALVSSWQQLVGHCQRLATEAAQPGSGVGQKWGQGRNIPHCQYWSSGLRSCNRERLSSLFSSSGSFLVSIQRSQHCDNMTKKAENVECWDMWDGQVREW